jgi:hypothetical protein
MNSMSKLGRNIKSVKVVMMMALLFCIFLCPHSADAVQADCSICEPGVECHDLCDCQSHSHQHECALDALHSHEFRDDTGLAFNWNFGHFNWTHVLLSFEEPRHPVCYSDVMANISSRSFAIRQLDTIILRV